jgi:hypothetical protein
LSKVKNTLPKVTPAPGFRRDRVAGVQEVLVFLDSGFRRNDRKGLFLTCYELVILLAVEIQADKRQGQDHDP